MLTRNKKINNIATIIIKLVRYNLQVIFGNLFIYFLLASVAFFIFVTVISLLDSNSNPTVALVYYWLLFPGILLIFYPTTFGIQNDADARMLETLFGIPDYRYKVWLVRMAIIFMLVLLILTGLAILSMIAIVKLNVFSMVVQLMVPVFFIGSLAFMMSTIVRNGYASMVFLIIIGMAFWILGGYLMESPWNLFLNPFRVPENVNEVVWADILFKNRLYIISATILMLLYGLLNMQKREKLVF